jgi:hypothetical protein
MLALEEGGGFHVAAIGGRRRAMPRGARMRRAAGEAPRFARRPAGLLNPRP